MLVVDASVAVSASLVDGFHRIGADLVAPALLWPEARSSLHELAYRGEVADDEAAGGRERLERAPIRLVEDDRLGAEAWRVADALGWAKTYDAEYVALARLLDCPLVTLDGRLRRGAQRVADVRLPAEL